MPRRRKDRPRNIADHVPCVCLEHEVEEDGCVKLLVPRFRVPWMQWLQKRLKKPHIKVKLDEIGSAAWLLIDSRRTVAQIGEALENRLGEKVQPVNERLGMFVGILRRNKFIILREPPGEVPSEPVRPT